MVDEQGPILNRLCYADNGIMIENGFVATTGLMDFDGTSANGFALLKGATLGLFFAKILSASCFDGASYFTSFKRLAAREMFDYSIPGV